MAHRVQPILRMNVRFAITAVALTLLAPLSSHAIRFDWVPMQAGSGSGWIEILDDSVNLPNKTNLELSDVGGFYFWHDGLVFNSLETFWGVSDVFPQNHLSASFLSGRMRASNGVDTFDAFLADGVSPPAENCGVTIYGDGGEFVAHGQWLLSVPDTGGSALLLAISMGAVVALYRKGR